MPPDPPHPPAPPHLSDEQLIDAINRGDADAFQTLYLRHRDWVYRVACRYTPDRDEALDVLQETFAYFLGRFPGFTLTARLTTYLFPIVRNIATTHRRKVRRRRFFSGPDLRVAPAPPPPPSPPDALDAALAALPDHHREVLLMRIVDEMTLAEVAAALQIPVGTVKSRLHNALATLRDDPACRRFFLEHAAEAISEDR